MRIAIPVHGDDVFSPMSGAEAFHFYEDDHGRNLRQFLVPLPQPGLEGAIARLEQYGIDALICDAVSEKERRAAGMASLMLFPGATGKADAAALVFLSGSVVSDRSYHCNACGFKSACSLKGKGSCGK